MVTTLRRLPNWLEHLEGVTMDSDLWGAAAVLGQG